MTESKNNFSKQTEIMLALSNILMGKEPPPATKDFVQKEIDRLSDIVKIAMSDVNNSLLAFIAKVSNAYREAVPFHLEIEKSLHEITGDNTRSIHDPALDDETLDEAIKHAIKRIFNDPSFDVDSVTLEDVLKRIEQNKANAVINTRAVLALQAQIPLDKLTDTFLKRGESITPEKKAMTIKTFNGEPAKKNKPAIPPAFVSLTYHLDQEAVNSIFGNGYVIQTGKITYFDFKVCIAIGAIFEEKQKRSIPPFMSLNEIYKNMTASKNKPTKTQLDRIRASLEKMMFTRIKIDTTREQHLESHSLSYTGYFIPCEIIEENGFINNNPAVLIHPYREPPIISFAKERGQFSTIDSVIFNKSPLTLTDENANIEYYLVKRILTMKHSDKQPKTILISTLLKECCKEVIPKLEARLPETVRKKQWDRQQRTKTNARAFLDHLKKENFIKGYKCDDDKISITL